MKKERRKKSNSINFFCSWHLRFIVPSEHKFEAFLSLKSNIHIRKKKKSLMNSTSENFQQCIIMAYLLKADFHFTSWKLKYVVHIIISTSEEDYIFAYYIFLYELNTSLTLHKGRKKMRIGSEKKNFWIATLKYKLQSLFFNYSVSAKRHFMIHFLWLYFMLHATYVQNYR